MSGILYAAVALGVVSIVLMLIATGVRAVRGLGRGETVALDNVTLYSARLELVGRPDRIVKRWGHYIPEEWKSSRHVSRSHQLQLGTYFLLIEEEHGVRPPFGVVVLGDGTRVKVKNTRALRAEVLAIARKCWLSRGRSAVGELY